MCKRCLPVEAEAFSQSWRAMQAALNLPPLSCRAVHRNVGHWEQVPFLSFILEREDFTFVPSLYSIESCVSCWKPPALFPLGERIEYKLHFSLSFLNIGLRIVQLVCVLEYLYRNAWRSLGHFLLRIKPTTHFCCCLFIAHIQSLWIYRILLRTYHLFIHALFFLAYLWNFHAYVVISMALDFWLRTSLCWLKFESLFKTQR